MLFGGDSPATMESVIYASSIFNKVIHVSRLLADNGTVDWTFGFPCETSINDVTITFRQNLVTASGTVNMLVAACFSYDKVLYGIMTISTDQSVAKLGPNPGQLQLVSEN
jgi:hypothetical protein